MRRRPGPTMFVATASKSMSLRGQSVSNVTVSDNLPSSLQIVGRNATNMFAAKAPALGTNIFVAGNSGGSAVTTAPDGSVTYNFGSLTGVAGVDAAFEFDFYVPRDTSAPVVATVPQGTDSTNATNVADARLNWTPLDPRDPNLTNLAPATSGSVFNHNLEQQAVAVQKTMQAFDATTGAPTTLIRPGSTLLKVTINFQVSDYFAVQNMILNDTIGDGLRLRLGTLPGALAAQSTRPEFGRDQRLLVCPSAAAAEPIPPAHSRRMGISIIPAVIPCNRPFLQARCRIRPRSPETGPVDPIFTNLAPGTIDGTTLLRFRISEELIRRLGANAGRLVGGEINNNGTGPDNDPITGPNLGATTGQIVYWLEVREDYSDDFPSVDRSVDQGDSLVNVVDDTQTGARDGIVASEIAANTINNTVDTNPAIPGVQAPVIGTATDDSSASVSIPYGVDTKEIVRINGQSVPTQTFLNPPFSVPGGRSCHLSLDVHAADLQL